MYAIIEKGKKQFKVEAGKYVKLDLMDLAPGDTVEFDKVLLVVDADNPKLGAPYVKGAKVIASVVEHTRAEKVKIIKFKRRKHHMKRQGHRQWYTTVKINEIVAA